MLTDPVLAIVALLVLWLLVRVRDRTASEVDDTGRREVRVRGRKGVKVIESLPPRPLAFGAIIRVPDGDVNYQVDLQELTCTCPEFRSQRAGLPPEAIGRICRHLSQALQTTGASSSMDNLVRSIVESGPTRRTYFEIPLGPEERVAVGHAPGSDRLDLFALEDGQKDPGSHQSVDYRKYGFSRAGQRWLDDEEPREADRIGAAIRELPLGASDPAD